MLEFFRSKKARMQRRPLTDLLKAFPFDHTPKHLAKAFELDGSRVRLEGKYEKGFLGLLEGGTSSPAAGRAVEGVGFAYVAYVHASGDFLDLSGDQPKGIWFANDYGVANWKPYAAVPCMNAGRHDVNVTTVLHLARFWTLLAKGTLVGAREINAITTRMMSFMFPNEEIACKVGVVGDLLAEAIRVKLFGRETVVVYQNLVEETAAERKKTGTTRLAQLRKVIESALKDTKF